MKKRMLSILLTVCMVLTLLPTAALAVATDSSGTGYTFTAVGGALAVTSDAGTSAWRTDPNIVGGGTADYTAVQSVSFGPAVKSIDLNAFQGCTGLTSITIPEGVTDINQSAFKGCTGLTGPLALPSTLTSIGVSAFEGCAGLTGTLTIPAGVSKISSNAFMGCAGLTGALTIPETVTSIDEFAFSGCAGLTSISIPASVATIGDYAFSLCSEVATLTVDAANAAYTAEGNILYNKDKTTLICCAAKAASATIAESVTAISINAFHSCKALTTITIPANVTSIGDSAFMDCVKLTSANFLRAAAPTMGNGVFNNVSKSPKFFITVPDIQTGYRDGAWLSKGYTALIAQPAMTGAAVISGTPMVGETLTLANNTVGGIAPVWYYTASSSATGGTSFAGGILTAAQLGKYIYLTVPADASHSGPISSNVLGPVTKKAAPAAPAATFSFDDGQLTGVTAAMEYSLGVDAGWIPCTGTSMTVDVAAVTESANISVRFTETADTLASAIQVIDITKALAPTGLAGVNANGGASDGKITGTAATMEYSANAAFNPATACTGTEIANLAAGDYYIRVKATGHVQASEAAIVNVGVNKIVVPVPTIASKVYTGSPQTADVPVSNDYTVTNAGGTDVGSYNVVLTLRNTATHQWTGGKTDPKTIQFTITQAPASELVSAPSIDYAAETVGTAATMQYKLAAGNWTTCTANMAITAFGWNDSAAVTVSFRTAGDANHTVGVTEQTLTIPVRPAAPPASAFTVTRPTPGKNNGTLEGTAGQYQYSKKANMGEFGYWTEWGGTKLTGIYDYTTYKIRTKAVAGTSFASKDYTVALNPKENAVITFVGGTVPYTGAAQPYEFATADQPGTILYTYEATPGSALTAGVPQNVGTYFVKATLNTETHYGTARVTLTISKKDVTITGVTAGNKVYDGTATATPGGTPVISGKIGTEDVTVTAGTAAFANKNVGNKAVTFSGYALGGTAAGNYNLTAQPASVNAEITAVTISTVTNGSVQVQKTYDGTTDPGILTDALDFIGKVGSDDVSITAVPGAYADADAGSGKTVPLALTLAGADCANYVLASSTFSFLNASISKGICGDLTATVPHLRTLTGAQTYDLGLLVAGNPNFKDVTYAIGTTTAGTVLSGDATVAGSTLTYTLLGTGAADATATVKVTVSSKNYSDKTAIITVKLTDKEVVTISGLSAAPDLVYTGSAQVGYTGTAAVSGDKVPTGELVYTYYLDNGTTKTTALNSGAAGEGAAPVKAGSYKLIVSVAENNASCTGSTTIPFAVGKKPITSPTAVVTAFTYTGVEQTYPLTEDTAYTITGNKKTAANETGYPVTAALADKDNTKWLDTGDTADKAYTFIIKKATITVTATDRSAYVGETAPVLGKVEGTDYTVAGLASGEGLKTPPTVRYATVPNMAAAGTVAIRAESAAAPDGGNYNAIVYVPGTLNITVRSSSGNYNPPLMTEMKTGGTTTGDNLDRLVSGKKTLTVTGTEGAKLVFDTAALKGISDVTSGSVKVEITDVSKDYQTTHGGKNVFTLTVTSGGKTVTDFGGSVTVSLPYTLKDGEKAEDVTVWYLAEDGTMTEIPADYDAKTGLATFTVTHFSAYVVGVAPWANPFTDVNAGAWYYDAVNYTHQKGLFTGVTATVFDPDAATTRATLWTVLARLDGQDTAGSAVWYEKAQTWAVEKKISDGKNPMDEITREQLVTMLWRRSGSPVLADYPGLSTFTDAGEISSYAQSAMAWAHQKGLVEGHGNQLMPTQTATRAQVATILMRYCENAVK